MARRLIEDGEAPGLPGRRATRGLLGLAALAWTGCAAPTVPPYSSSTPIVLTTARAAGIEDLRGVYRAALCRRLTGSPLPCDEVLLELAGEPSSPPSAPRPGIAQRYRVAFVAGPLPECLTGIVQPFAEPMDDLARSGFSIHSLSARGRSGRAAIAAELARQLSALRPDSRPLIVFAYAAGLPDVLEVVVRYPEVASSIGAIVSVAGAMNGTLFADRLEVAFRAWRSSLPIVECGQAGGDEMLDLRRQIRIAWWQEHRAAMTKQVFTLVAAPRLDRVSPMLKDLYRELARIEPRNDGQLIWYDQIVPGGSLLGYVNADHWAVALSMARVLPTSASLFIDEVPRTALIEAAIETVDGVQSGRSAR